MNRKVKLNFIARKIGSLGIGEVVEMVLDVEPNESDESIRLRLYEWYEHISKVEIEALNES